MTGIFSVHQVHRLLFVLAHTEGLLDCQLCEDYFIRSLKFSLELLSSGCLLLQADYRHDKALNTHTPRILSFSDTKTIYAQTALRESEPVKAIYTSQCSDQPPPKTKVLFFEHLYFYSLIPILFSDSYQASLLYCRPSIQ